jgi:hypothetical protein
MAKMKNMDTGKIGLSPEGIQAVREVIDKANAAQEGSYVEDYVEALFADTFEPCTCNTR